MKHRMLAFTVVGLVAGSFLTGCDKSSEAKVQDAKETVGEARQDLKVAQAQYLADWQAFKLQSEQQIETNEKRIAAFSEKTEKAGASARAQYTEQVAALEQRNRELKKTLDEYKDEGESKWVEFKANFSRDMDAIGKTMSDLFKDTN